MRGTDEEVFDWEQWGEIPCYGISAKICVQNDSVWYVNQSEGRVYGNGDYYELGELDEVLEFTYYGGTFYLLTKKQLYITKDFTNITKVFTASNDYDFTCFNPITMSVYSNEPKRYYMSINKTTQEIQCSGYYGINKIRSDELSSHGVLTISTNTDINAFTIWLTNPSIYVNNILSGVISSTELIDKDKIILRNDIDSIHVPQYSKIESLEARIVALEEA